MVLRLHQWTLRDYCRSGINKAGPNYLPLPPILLLLLLLLLLLCGWLLLLPPPPLRILLLTNHIIAPLFFSPKPLLSLAYGRTTTHQKKPRKSTDWNEWMSEWVIEFLKTEHFLTSVNFYELLQVTWTSFYCKPLR